MKYKLIALDLDGTLKNSLNEITPRTKAALMKAQQQGIKLVLSSGRPTPGLFRDVKELEMDKYNGYLLSYNGAKISNTKGEIIYKQELDKEFAKEVYQQAKKLHLEINTYTDHGILCENIDAEYVRLEANLVSLPIKKVDCLANHLPTPLFKLLLSEKPEYVASVVNDLASMYSNDLAIYRSAPFFIEVVSKGIDKGQSLEHLCDSLGITMEEVLAFGDGYNDLSMLELAGCGVAMANAVDEVKQKADYCTLSNDEDGIAVFLEQLM